MPADGPPAASEASEGDLGGGELGGDFADFGDPADFGEPTLGLGGVAVPGLGELSAILGLMDLEAPGLRRTYGIFHGVSHFSSLETPYHAE
jgi:hypothetical protein